MEWRRACHLAQRRLIQADRREHLESLGGDPLKVLTLKTLLGTQLL